MGNQKEEIYIDMEDELDEDIIDSFTEDIEEAINVVMRGNSAQDCRLELLTVLSTFAAQVALDLDVHKERFLELSSELFQEMERLISSEEEVIDKSKLN